MAKIVTVYNDWKREFVPADMSYIRWLKISEALARLGHEVDIATNESFKWWQKKSPIRMGQNLSRIPLSHVRWSDYEVVKTLFHIGFETLEAYRGNDHPFVISKLGSVVGPEEMEGIYFYGKRRAQMFATQGRIDRTSKYITVLSKPAKELWEDCFGSNENLLIVPGAVDRDLPLPVKDPFLDHEERRCIFAGHIYIREVQPEANLVLVDKLNALGELLSRRDIRLYLLGSGDVGKLDQRYVTYLGVVPYEQAWDYFRFAQVGVVIAAGKYNHNNESSKVYHYLRAGLPVVSEAGFPNDHVIKESRLGFVVENGNMELLAEQIVAAAEKDWDRDYAIQYILDNHTWDRRVQVYDQLIKQNFN